MIACSSLSLTLSHPSQKNVLLDTLVTMTSLILKSRLSFIDKEDSDPVVSDICISCNNLFLKRCFFDVITVDSRATASQRQRFRWCTSYAVLILHPGTFFVKIRAESGRIFSKNPGKIRAKLKFCYSVVFL